MRCFPLKAEQPTTGISFSGDPAFALHQNATAIQGTRFTKLLTNYLTPRDGQKRLSDAYTKNEEPLPRIPYVRVDLFLPFYFRIHTHLHESGFQITFESNPQFQTRWTPRMLHESAARFLFKPKRDLVFTAFTIQCQTQACLTLLMNHAGCTRLGSAEEDWVPPSLSAVTTRVRAFQSCNERAFWRRAILKHKRACVNRVWLQADPFHRLLTH